MYIIRYLFRQRVPPARRGADFCRRNPAGRRLNRIYTYIIFFFFSASTDTKPLHTPGDIILINITRRLLYGYSIPNSIANLFKVSRRDAGFFFFFFYEDLHAITRRYEFFFFYNIYLLLRAVFLTCVFFFFFSTPNEILYAAV